MKRNIRTIIFILILGILIILPPLFRVLFPKEKDYIRNRTLTCTLRIEHYQVTSKTIYKDSKVDHVQIKYSDLSFPKENLHVSKLANQVNYFCGLQKSSFYYVNGDVVITLDQKAYQANSHDKTIKNMYKSYASLKKYYEKLGYDCKL